MCLMHVFDTCHICTAYCIWSVSFNMNLQSQSHWSMFNRRCSIGLFQQKRPIEQEHRMRFEIEEMTLQMQYAVFDTCFVSLS